MATTKRWIVTACNFDIDGQCDDKARVLIACNSKEEAKNFILEDMREYVDLHADEGMILDEDKMRVADDSCLNGCEWNLEEVEIDLGIEADTIS